MRQRSWSLCQINLLMVEQYIFDVSVAAELEEVKHCEACEVGMATFVTI